MKYVKVRIKDDLYNKVELYIKREGITKQYFISSLIEEKISIKDITTPFAKNKDELDIINKKINLLLENQVEINDLLTKLIGTDYAKK